MPNPVGLIANPASGRDIRRLVAHASVFDNDEKVYILRRAIAGLAATGVRRVLYLPDPYRLVERAFESIDNGIDAEPVAGSFHSQPSDTTQAAAAMQEAGAAALISLGGDGTNRVLAKGASRVPLVPISTGTNNVFPFMLEGTTAGLAAGAIAAGHVCASDVSQPSKRVVIEVAGRDPDIALIDAAVTNAAFTGSRAVWEIESLREVLLTRAQPWAIGLSALGGMLDVVRPDDDCGLHVSLAPRDAPNGAAPPRRVRAPIGPGLIRDVDIARVARVALGATIHVAGPAMFALDGEREFSIKAGEHAELSIDRGGPPIVDIERCLDALRSADFTNGS